MSEQKERDDITGRETTGHEWDGIKELNTPLPRWWLWVFYATIVWAIGYWLVMPAWPLLSDYTRGVLGWSSRARLNAEIAEARAAQSGFVKRIEATDLAAIEADPELLEFALAGGRSAFGLYCAQCHGRGAQGAPGIPNLNDDDWIWGGDLETIHETIRVGVRSDHDETRFNAMPAFVADEILSEDEAEQVADYVLSLSNPDITPDPQGAALFADNCAACHGEAGEGVRELGGPRLNDAIWLYGGSREDVLRQIRKPRHGVMPTWESRLDPATIKELAIYVHMLGGGE